MSITLGKSRSYLWTVTAGGVNLSRLPGEEELTSQADSFAAAVRLGRDAALLRNALSRALFQNLPADVWNRSEWMMVADGPLLNGMPFCALSDLKGRPLIEDKTLRFLPSELLLAERLPARTAPKDFVGVGDPIYNLADPRLQHSGPADAKSVSESVMLTRLVASGREIQAAAQETRMGHAVLLTGPNATRANLTAALANNASILHFAVHVVSPPGQRQQAALALSLRNGIPELLTPEAIAAFRVPGSLVVLSGCSSGLGKVVPGAGLQGLSRAWLLAGASAVVVSNWPTPDDSGKFFSAFYDHFDHIKSGDTAQRAALALRQAQLDMLHGSGYKTSPQFWGAFAVIAKE
jgi:CHAT domain-containing protein